VGLSKTQTSKPIAAQPRVGAGASVDLFETTTCKPCAVPKRVAAEVNAALFVTVICRRLAAQKLYEQRQPVETRLVDRVFIHF
jgi:hypothetical protein